VRLDEARRRLVALPDPLPRPPAELRAVLLAGSGSDAPRLPPRPREWRDAAVLVLLYPGPAREATVLLTERPVGDLRHSGQISFPGGAVEPFDASPEAAALREATEEVGLDPRALEVTILGRLDPIEVTPSRFRVVPVLAVTERSPALAPDPREVASIVEAPLTAFLPGAPIEVVEAESDARRLRYGGYRVGRFHVWGATAHILGQLGEIMGR
jgi:8-oxo-dGTP pyrophosphatase MutT (NUDIX family)